MDRAEVARELAMAKTIATHQRRVETDTNSPLVTFLESVTGKKAGSVAYGTEGAQMTILGSEAVVLGPGDIREAHRTGEFVPVDELNRCVDILSQAIRHFCY